MKNILSFLSFIFFIVNLNAQTTNFIDIKLKDTSKIKISGRTTVIGNTSNISNVNSNGYSNNYDKILFSVESGDPSISGQSVGGFLTPRMTTSQRNTIFNSTTINGTLIYNTTTNTLEYYNTGSNSWVQLGGGANFWTLATNGTDIYNTNSGNIGIKTNSPRAKLEVNGKMHVGNELTTLGLNYFNNSSISIGNINIINGILNTAKGIYIASNADIYKYNFIVDSVGNIKNPTANTTLSGNLNVNNTIDVNNNITTNWGNLNVSGKLISTSGKFKSTVTGNSGSSLPIQFPFTSYGGYLIVTFSCTAYTTTAAKTLEVGMTLDQATINIANGDTYDNTFLMANLANTHYILPQRTVWFGGVGAGNHILYFKPYNGDTKMDYNNSCYVSVTEIPF